MLTMYALLKLHHLLCAFALLPSPLICYNLLIMSTDPHKLSGAVKNLALELGFDLVGITSAAPLVQAGQRFCQAVRSGHTADMHYLQRDPDQRSSPQARFPWAKGIISVGLNYHFVPPGPTSNPKATNPATTNHSAPGPEKSGLISCYALGRDYHLVMSEKLKLFQEKLAQTIGQDFRNRLAVDTLAIMEKPLAQRAGLGFQGKNSLLINPKFGSWIFLGELITGLDLAPDLPAQNQCGDCRACLDACPTGALLEPGILDARKCLSYLTIECKGDIPPQIIAKITTENTCIFGCDLCQQVCPFNRDTPKTKERQFHPRVEILNLNVEQLSDLTEPQFQKLFVDTPLARLSYQQFQRNFRLLRKL